MNRIIAMLIAALLALGCASAALAEDGAPDWGFRGDEIVEEQVVYDAEGLRITAKGLEIVQYAPMLTLSIENNSGDALALEVVESALNDWIWDASLCLYEDNGGDPDDDVFESVSDLTIADGETVACGLGFSNEYWYEPCGIVGFGKISFALRVFDPESDDTRFTTPAIDVATSLGADYPGLYRDVGTLAYDADGVRILIAGVQEDEFSGPRPLIYVNNYSDAPVLILAESCAVNGTPAEPWFSAMVSPGRQCLEEMGFPDEIDEIDRLDVAFRVEEYVPYYTEDANVIGVSDVVGVEF